MIQRNEPTFWAEIAIAGDYDDARRICRQFCERGLCVTVTPTTYIYTGGEQAGVLVRLINYPRFPADPPEIEMRALELGDELREGLCQDSFAVVTPERTYWRSRREDRGS